MLFSTNSICARKTKRLLFILNGAVSYQDAWSAAEGKHSVPDKILVILALKFWFLKLSQRKIWSLLALLLVPLQLITPIQPRVSCQEGQCIKCSRFSKGIDNSVDLCVASDIHSSKGADPAFQTSKLSEYVRIYKMQFL